MLMLFFLFLIGIFIWVNIEFIGYSPMDNPKSNTWQKDWGKMK